jgi:hypothetical protein
VSECRRGEEAAKRNYEEALQQAPGPEVRSLIEHQLNGIREAIERLAALESVMGGQT